MSNDSDTSADLQFNILDNLGSKIEVENKEDTLKKPETSDTDYYLNLIANQSKVNPESVNKSETSSSISILESDKDDSDSDSSSSSDKKKSTESSKSSTETSQPKFEKVNLSPKKIKSPTQAKILTPKKMEVKKELSPQEARMKKIELLRKLSELKSKGYELSKSYNFDSSIEEMEYEFELLKSFANKRNGVKLYKNILLNTVSAVEFLNDKYDPFEFQLTGWSEHMSVEVDSYDEVIEELYEKYKGTGKSMPAEVKLLLLILASASAFHFSKSTFKNLPGVDKIMENNPDLIAKMINPKKESSQFMTEQEINLEKQKENILKKEKEAKARVKAQAQPQVNTFQSQNFAPVKQPESVPLQRAQEVQKQTLKAPMNVQDILNRLHNSENNNNTTDTQEETSSNNDRIINSSSMNTSERGRGRKKKEIMTIM